MCCASKRVPESAPASPEKVHVANQPSPKYLKCLQVLLFLQFPQSHPSTSLHLPVQLCGLVLAVLNLAQDF